MATKKTSKTAPKAPKKEPEVEAVDPDAYTHDELLHIQNVVTTGYGLGPESAVIVHRESHIPKPGSVPMALAQTLTEDHTIIPMRAFSEAQYSIPEIREIVESDRA